LRRESAELEKKSEGQLWPIAAGWLILLSGRPGISNPPSRMEASSGCRGSQPASYGQPGKVAKIWKPVFP